MSVFFPTKIFVTGYDNSQIFLCLFLLAAVQTDFHLVYDFNTSACNMITLTVEQDCLGGTKPQSSVFTALGTPELHPRC